MALRIAALRRRLLGDRRGMVAVVAAVIMTALLGTTALGLEAGSWSVVTVELQRRADAAAYTAARQYMNGSTAQQAAGFGADVAVLNGAAASGRVWNATTNTLAASDVSVQLVNGVHNILGHAMKVVATRSMPTAFGLLLTKQTTVSVSVTSYAEIVSTTGGGQPCVVALKSNGTGVTVSGGVTVTGGSVAAGSSCTIRSNAGVSVTNGSHISAPWVYANGTVTVSGNSSITDGTHTVIPTNVGTWTNAAPLYKSAGTIVDPYASNPSIVSDFGALSPGKGTAFTGTWQPSTLSPGTYSNITTGSGNVTLNPGLYTVNGNISVGNGAAFSGTGVTIVTSGSITIGGGSAVTLSAPVANSTSGGIPGVVIAGTAASTYSFSNGAAPVLTGVVYYPNGTVAVSGGVTMANACLEVVAGSVTFTNGATFGDNCTNYATTTFGSIVTSSVALVQ